MSHRPPPACNQAEHALHRRLFLASSLAGAGTATLASVPGLRFATGTALAEPLKQQQRRVLLIWLAGGSSQFETWDPKPGRKTGGPFQAISTAVPGYQVSELMPKMAARMNHLAVIRSLDTGISEHGQAADLISTGRLKEPALVYPELGAALAKELAARDTEVPDYVSVFLSGEGRRRQGPGYLGSRYAPIRLENSLRPQHIDLPEGMTDRQYEDRESLRQLLSDDFARDRADRELVTGYNAAYARARGVMRCDHLFDLEREPTAVRERYGRTEFGQHCLLARRLLEAGVPTVKIARGFWDSHHDNFESHRELVPDFDNCLSVLLDDLLERGLLESTLVVVFSEFGRTPKINKDLGRDHFADAWSMALAGCGVLGGAIHGRTDADGIEVADGKAKAGDVAATLFAALGIDPHKHNYVGLRPVPLAPEDARPIKTVLS